MGKAMTKDQYLYLHIEEQIVRLNICQLVGCGGSDSRPEFEVVCDYSKLGLPIGMGCAFVNSKLCLIGGHREVRDDYFYSSDVYTVDAAGQVQLVVAGGEEGHHMMLTPKPRPVVVTLDGKIYVLGRKPSTYCPDLDPPVFQFFDPAAKKWTALPSPPWTSHGSISVLRHFTLPHKIFFCRCNDIHMFDTEKGKWYSVNWKSLRFPSLSGDAAKFGDFLVGMTANAQKLVAYRLNHNGLPMESRVLFELSEMFPRPSVHLLEITGTSMKGSVFPLDGDGDCGDSCRRMCFLLVETAPPMCASVGMFRASVGVFRVCIQTDNAATPVLEASFEKVEHYHFDPLTFGSEEYITCDSAFVTCDDLNKHDVEAEASFIDANLS